MLNFISFGSGSSGNCYFLYTETEGLLIDAGIGIRSLKKYFTDYGLTDKTINGILVTHDHADHIKAVGAVSSDWFLPVYATQPVHRGITQNYCVRKKVKPGYERTITYHETFCIGAFEVTPFPVPHDSSDNVGYIIRHDGNTFCIITDAGAITPEIEHAIKEADYLVLESNYEYERLMAGPYPQYLKERIVSGRGHLSNIQCGKAIAENATAKLKHVWLAHLSEENNHPELARKTIEHMLRNYGIIAGEDFKLDVLKRKTPTFTSI